MVKEITTSLLNCGVLVVSGCITKKMCRIRLNRFESLLLHAFMTIPKSLMRCSLWRIAIVVLLCMLMGALGSQKRYCFTSE